MEFRRRKPLSLLELCVRKAIDNLRYMGSVDGIEMDLLQRILPHCTMEHLTKIQSETKMDISSVTDPLWKRFYQREFGQEHFNKVVTKLKSVKETHPEEKYTWWNLFEVPYFGGVREQEVHFTQPKQNLCRCQSLPIYGYG